MGCISSQSYHHYYPIEFLFLFSTSIHDRHDHTKRDSRCYIGTRYGIFTGVPRAAGICMLYHGVATESVSIIVKKSRTTVILHQCLYPETAAAAAMMISTITTFLLACRTGTRYCYYNRCVVVTDEAVQHIVLIHIDWLH